jgi:hypothetical protein
MHSDWFNGIDILQGRWQHGEKVGYCYPSGLEKTLCKWEIYVPLDTKRLNNTPQFCFLLKYTLSTALFILCCSDGHTQEAPQAFVTRCDEQRSSLLDEQIKTTNLLKKTNFWPKLRSVPADMPNNKPIFSLFRAKKDTFKTNAI